jgi:transcription elongation factor Elf1
VYIAGGAGTAQTTLTIGKAGKQIVEPEPDFVVEPEKVVEEFACPRCGERRLDLLVWQGDEEMVKCESCGTFTSLEKWNDR